MYQANQTVLLSDLSKFVIYMVVDIVLQRLLQQDAAPKHQLVDPQWGFVNILHWNRSPSELLLNISAPLHHMTINKGTWLVVESSRRLSVHSQVRCTDDQVI